MYPEPGSGLVNRLTCDVKGRDQQGHEVQIADACLNDVMELVLFEMKAARVRDNAVLDDNHERYLDELRKKYGVSTGDGARRSIKGVGQLARTISKLADREWTPIGQDFSAVQRIYPVLLVHDPLLDAPVHGNFLASEFAMDLAPDELPPSGDMRKGRFRVTPLIVMTIEDGEDLIIIAGEPVTARLFLMQLCYARYTFVMASPSQRQEALLEGHVRAFRDFQAVPRDRLAIYWLTRHYVRRSDQLGPHVTWRRGQTSPESVPASRGISEGSGL